MQQALSEEVAVRENGRRRKISKREVALTQLLNKAAQGDRRAIRYVRLQAELAQ